VKNAGKTKKTTEKRGEARRGIVLRSVVRELLKRAIRDGKKGKEPRRYRRKKKGIDRNPASCISETHDQIPPEQRKRGGILGKGD